MAIIQGNAKSSSAAGGFYPKVINGSLRFNDDDSAYLSRTPASAGNRKTMTFSFWFKIGNINTNKNFYGYWQSGTNYNSFIYIDNVTSGGQLRIYDNDGSTVFDMQTSQFFRDPSAWYHLVLAIDTTQTTPSNRMKLYINGEQVTSFASTPSYPAIDDDCTVFNNSVLQYIGYAPPFGGGQYMDGYIANFHFIDGQALTESDFGETKNGVWVAKDVSDFIAATTTATFSSGTNSITVTSATGINVGQDIAGTGIPLNTYVTAVSGTTITISQNTTASSSGNYTFGGHGQNGFYLTFEDDTQVEAFNTVLYEGNGATSTSTQSITGVGFSPDFVWIKNRDNTTSNSLYDTIRGADVTLRSNTTDKDFDYGNTLLSFDSDGFTVGNYSHVNGNGLSHVAWCWKAGGAPTVDNSAGAGSVPTAGSVKIDGVNSISTLAGSLPAIRLSASTTYGFSIVTWQANNQSVGTVAHGLGVAPDMLIIKNRDSSTNAQWVLGHSAFGFNGQGYLNLTAGFGTNSGSFNNTAPTSTVFTVGTDQTVNLGTNKYIGYCWAETSGYSKIDGYSGSTSDITIYTTDDGTSGGANPFKPAFVFIKRSDSDTDAYSLIFDNTRDVEGDNGRHLFANFTNGESDSVSRKITFNDNGFTIPASASADASVNAGSSSTYVYAAFADTREAAFWLDQSGNDNDWQPVNLDHNDTVSDSPTDNFCTWSPINQKGITLSDGNLTAELTYNTDDIVAATMAVNSGQWYWEVYCDTASTVASETNIGITSVDTAITLGGANRWPNSYYYQSNGQKRIDGTASAYGTAYSTGITVGVALDCDANTVEFFRNNQSQGVISIDADTTYYATVATGGAATSKVTANFGQQPFKYDPPA